METPLSNILLRYLKSLRGSYQTILILLKSSYLFRLERGWKAWAIGTKHFPYQKLLQDIIREQEHPDKLISNQVSFQGNKYPIGFTCRSSSSG